MSFYNTGNPVPSIDPRDLDDNAKHLDVAVTTQETTWVDRTGATRKSLKGLENGLSVMEGEFDAAQEARTEEFLESQEVRSDEFNAFLAGTQYEVPVAYATGLNITRATQTVLVSGLVYRPIPGYLPFVTTTFAADSAKWTVLGDASLRQELSQPEGSLKSGWVRTYPLVGPVSTVGLALSLQPINILEKQFTDLITDKPNVNDQNTWDWAPAIQAASNLVRTRFNTYGPGIQNVIDFPGSVYPVRAKVTISPFAKLRALGMVVFQTSVANESAFHFTPSTGDYSATTVVRKQQWFRGPFINGLAGGFTWRNMLAATGCTGIELGPRTDTSVASPFARYSATDFAVEGYAIGIKFNRFRNYIGFFTRAHMELNTINCAFGDSGTIAVDSGENITFDDCIFAGAQTSFRWYCDGFDVNFIGCSADFIGIVFWASRLYRKISWVGGHIEGIGGAYAHDGIGGILLEDSADSADNGIAMTVAITGMPAAFVTANMFRGSSRVNLLLDFEFRKSGNITTPEGMFLCDPRITLRKKQIVCQGKAVFPSWAVNSLRNPTFAADVVGAAATVATPPIGYTVTAGSRPGVVDASASTLGGKSIKITGAASGNYYVLESTSKLPIQPGEVAQASLFAKFDAAVSVAAMGVIAQIIFYNDVDAVISSTPEPLNDLGSSALVAGQWTAHAYARHAAAPAGATYYKVRLGVSGFAMNSVDTYISALYTTVLK
jgi:hypothetical protein